MKQDACKLARALVGVLAALWLAAFTPLFAQYPAKDATAACARKNQVEAVTVRGLVFKSDHSDDGVCLQVTGGGKVLYSQTGDSFESFTLGQPEDAQENISAIANGTDVTGRGRPDMIVSLFTGGAHCCMTHYVFELAPEFKLLATLSDADDDLAHFARFRDGRYYYITADWTFAYWPTCFACSPSEVVTLRWADDKNGGGFHLAMDKMQKPAPTTAAWNNELSAAKKDVNGGAVDDNGRTMWQTVLDLIYTGHSDLAWKFVDALGPKAQQKPFSSLADFCSLLKQSPYWVDLQPTLKDTPVACANAGPKQSK